MKKIDIRGFLLYRRKFNIFVACLAKKNWSFRPVLLFTPIIKPYYLNRRTVPFCDR